MDIHKREKLKFGHFTLSSRVRSLDVIIIIVIRTTLLSQIHVCTLRIRMIGIGEIHIMFYCLPSFLIHMYLGVIVFFHNVVAQVVTYFTHRAHHSNSHKHCDRACMLVSVVYGCLFRLHLHENNLHAHRPYTFKSLTVNQHLKGVPAVIFAQYLWSCDDL